MRWSRFESLIKLKIAKHLFNNLFEQKVYKLSLVFQISHGLNAKYYKNNYLFENFISFKQSELLFIFYDQIKTFYFSKLFVKQCEL